MFTGIITDIGIVQDVEIRANERRFIIGTQYDTATIAVGASIAHDGCCLTVTDILNKAYSVDVSPHTLAHTTLGTWDVGRHVNLERALKVGDELGGHMVSGHIDGLATIVTIKQEGQSRHYTIQCDRSFARFIAAKGSVTLDGTSLTVTWVKDCEFGLTLIPHTLDVTTWGERRTGDVLNLEIDMLARYMARLSEMKD